VQYVISCLHLQLNEKIQQLRRGTVVGIAGEKPLVEFNLTKADAVLDKSIKKHVSYSLTGQRHGICRHTQHHPPKPHSSSSTCHLSRDAILCNRRQDIPIGMPIFWNWPQTILGPCVAQGVDSSNSSGATCLHRHNCINNLPTHLSVTCRFRWFACLSLIVQVHSFKYSVSWG